MQGRKVLLAAAVAAAVFSSAGKANAQTPGIVVENGETQEAFNYAGAVRDRVWVDSDFDSDADGLADKIAVDIIRPAETNNGLKAPVIMDASPYYSTLGRGNESQLKVDDASGLLQKWPLFLDNYFVPRGYAIALVDMTGTNHSTGCPTVQDATDNNAAVDVIDWFKGRRTAHDKDGNLVPAPAWFNGKTGMIGKSYDGALAAAAAVTGVDGLTTIVGESGPYDYYDYTRSNGVIQRGGHYVSSLANTVTDANRQAYCKPTRDKIDANDADATGDFTTPFWNVRNYVKDAPKVRASVFLTHGMGDENVRFDHFSRFWYALQDLGVPSKAWLMQTGHVDPFDNSRAKWVDTLHHWFDYWLEGVQNGIMSQPQVSVETSPGVLTDAASWPVPGTKQTQLFLKPGAELGLAPATGAEQTTTFQDSASQRETAMLANPTTVTANRRVFLTPPLSAPVRLSGTPTVQLDASADKTSTHLGAILVDFGPAFPRVNRATGDGVQTLTTTSCYGQASAVDNGCYKDVGERIDTTTTAWRVTKGVLDAGHRTSRNVTTPIVAGTRYPFSFPLLPNDYTFPAGHQIGVVIVGSYRDYGTTASTTAANITFSLKNSRISLPIVGGDVAARAAGISGGEPTTTTVADTGSAFTATVAGSAPAASPLPADLMAEALNKADFAGFTKLDTAGGAVQFLDGGQPLGAPVPLVGGVATLPVPALSGGSHQISATYVGAGAYAASTSAEITRLVPVNSTVGGSVPATLSLVLGAPATFGAFTPGLAKDYTATTPATVLSTAGDAALTVSDPGHLMNGTFSLPSPLAVSFSKAAWTAPVSNDPVTITFKQHVDATDALRTGAYTKTLTFTLSTTTP
ncbi:CocE/NonD family hydrolase [Solirubrobacter ginsenosidimutans]|uniref:CocE/NonD family hydrolase n=1 Tax=Solirubrobacter ginsenosidimutans TaxID=490573 RepID=A0A9X3MPA5_9ACTN|nr:CocE/NonD family hydrolase [Solirubrobacter ginsenosidimutans]MDA0159296.1 CocE/NonD family hydrolase [Solirubrobacter ginsenosidimutans]